MKRFSAALLAIGIAASGSAFAQSTYSTYSPSGAGYYGNDGYNTVPQNDAYFDYARVIRVDPAGAGYGGVANYGGQRCYETQSPGSYSGNGYNGNDGYNRNDPYNRSQYGNGSTTGRTVATVVGGIAGAVLGSQVGGGTGSVAASAIGTMVGGMAGRQVYENTQRDRYTPAGTVRVCDPDPNGNSYNGYNQTSNNRAGGYDVTYEYNGRRYTRRMNYNPGQRVRVRVDVSPQ